MAKSQTLKPAYRVDIQEWVSEQVYVNGERKRRRRLLRVIAWGVPFLVGRAQQREFKASAAKPVGHFILIPKHKTGIKTYSPKKEMKKIESITHMVLLLQRNDTEIYHEVAGRDYVFPKVAIYNTPFGELLKDIIGGKLSYKITTKESTGQLF